MAMPYPEGEAFFKRSVLKSRSDGRFNAEDPAHFYSTRLVEMGHPHARSNYQIVYGSGLGTAYGNWSWCPFTYGNWRFPKRRVQCELCTSGNRCPMRTATLTCKGKSRLISLVN
ncbi:hypothetical protein BJX66DRAFT_342150 [Aspergillus keveii]|uniref:Uncharacterized protein n=1 Tax=Aspergillus keveii TaxID=714993 RepID=A0ABR4FT71_9EURO